MKFEAPQLSAGEQIGLETKGDTWKKPEYARKAQVSGKFFFTNRAMYFRTWGPRKDKIAYEVAYEQVAQIEPCRIQLFMTTGIKFKMKDGGEYIISVNRRNKYMEYMNQYIQG